MFTCMTCASIYAIPNIEIGLDQQLSMSKSSYVYKYFQVSGQCIHKLLERMYKNVFTNHLDGFISGDEWIAFDGTACVFCS